MKYPSFRYDRRLLAGLALFATVFQPFSSALAAGRLVIEEPELPQFSSGSANILDYGAEHGNCEANTAAFAQAINELAASGGGKLVVPSGEWLTGPIVLKSKIELHLEPDSLIQFSSDRDDYPLVETSFEGRSQWRCQSPISGFGLHDIAITGAGRIDGAGQVWRPVKKVKQTVEQWRTLVASGGVLGSRGEIWYPTEGARLGNEEADKWRNLGRDELRPVKDALRPVLLSLQNCERVLLDGVTFENSPSWCLHPLMCTNLTVRGITVKNPWYAQNGDGLDVDSCTQVLIEDSRFEVGDDAICLKSGRDEEGRARGRPTENVIVRNCTVFHGHGGFVVGSEMSGGVRNVLVSDCVFDGTDVGLRFKSRRGRGGVVENIVIENISMKEIKREAIIFNLYYATRDSDIDWDAPAPIADETTPAFRNIEISGIECQGAGRAALFRGLPEMAVENVSIDRSAFSADVGLNFSDVNGIVVSNTVLQILSGPAVELRNATRVDLSGLDLSFHKGPKVVAVGQLNSEIKYPSEVVPENN